MIRCMIFLRLEKVWMEGIYVEGCRGMATVLSMEQTEGGSQVETQARCVKIASFAVEICTSSSRSRREISWSLVWHRSKVK